MTAAHHDAHVAPAPHLRLVAPAAPDLPADPAAPVALVAPATPAPPVAPVDPQPAPPRLRLRALPQPQPAAWSPEQPARRGQEPGPQQLALVLHGIPRAVPEASPDCPVPTPSSELPCPDALARSLVQAAVDVVRGHRPASQVLRWTTPEVYSQLRQRALLEQARARPGGRRPVVRSLRTAPAGPRGTEVSAVVLDGPRARAVAARLDGEDGRWRLTALVIG